MKKTVIFIILSAGICKYNYCQTSQNQNKFRTTVNNVYDGLKESVRWYDIPISVAYFYRNNIENSGIGNKIIIKPGELERSITNNVGAKGRFTLGSIDKDIIPNIYFYSRLTTSIALNLFTDADITKENYRDIFLFKKSLIYTYTLTEYVKSIIKRTRPNGKDDRSFFSGHTSTTFAAATYLWKELDDFYDRWDITKTDPTLKTTFEVGTFTLLYGWASFVGYSRIRDYKHYFTDVLVGAAVGTLVSHFVYELFHEKDMGLINNINITSSHRKSFALSFNLNL